MKPRAIDFVMYNVSDMDRSVKFYKDTLGIDAPFNEESDTWMEFDTLPLSFALCKPSQKQPWQGSPAIALAVSDIYKTMDELKKKGVKVINEAQETSVCYMGFIEDPDGNRICIHQRKDGTAGKQPKK